MTARRGGGRSRAGSRLATTHPVERENNQQARQRRPMRDHRTLPAYQHTHELVTAVHDTIQKLPGGEAAGVGARMGAAGPAAGGAGGGGGGGAGGGGLGGGGGGGPRPRGGG